jgi:DNA polymerase/3'-5' exonuclease PolX
LEWKQAHEIALAIVDWLRPGCQRVEIAGSLRRQKPWVSDIEIVAKPKLTPFDELAPVVHCLIADGRLGHGQPSSGQEKVPFGPRYYRLALLGTPYMQVDLFVVMPPAQWGVIYCVRTGSREFSHWLATQAYLRGYRLHDSRLCKRINPQGPLATDWRDDEILEPVPCPEERDLFQTLGLAWIHPTQREFAPGQGA